MRILRFFAIALFLNVIAYSAAAHTALVSAAPEENAILESAPSQVRLEFSESLMLIGEENPNRIEVRDESGQLISAAAIVDGPVAIAQLTPATGLVSVSYHVVASDGHVVEGEYQYTVETPKLVSIPEHIDTDDNKGSNLLIRVVWTALVLSAIGLLFLIRLRK